MNNELASVLVESKIAVIPTDTIYGIVARAEDQNAVERVYSVRQRNPSKPCIILISSISDIKNFGIEVTQFESTLASYWPGPVSIVVPCPASEFDYLHRGTNSLCFRMPDVEWLIELIGKTGPLIAPSANIEGNTPARNVAEAREQFGDDVDFYMDGGDVDGKPSKVISLLDGTVTVLRD